MTWRDIVQHPQAIAKVWLVCVCIEVDVSGGLFSRLADYTTSLQKALFLYSTSITCLSAYYANVCIHI